MAFLDILFNVMYLSLQRFVQSATVNKQFCKNEEEGCLHRRIYLYITTVGGRVCALTTAMSKQG